MIHKIVAVKDSEKIASDESRSKETKKKLVILFLKQKLLNTLQRQAEKLLKMNFNLNVFLRKPMQGVESANLSVYKYIKKNLVTVGMYREHERNQISSKVTDSFLKIKSMLNEMKQGNITRGELVKEIVRQTASLGISQVIGWTIIEAGNGSQMPLEVLDYYKELIESYGNYTEEEKIQVINDLKVRVAKGDSRKMLALLQYASDENVSINIIKMWGVSFANNLVNDGLLELDEKDSVLKLVATSGKPCYIGNTKETVFSEIQDAGKIGILNKIGLSSYSILPIRNIAEELLLVAENEGTDLINSSKVLQNRSFHEDIIGVVHLLIDEGEKEDLELLKFKIKSTQLFLNMAAQALAGVEFEVYMQKTQSLLEGYTTRLIGEEQAKKVFAIINISREIPFHEGDLVTGTVLFSDIKGFTGITEAFEKVGQAKLFVKYLNQYLTVAENKVKIFKGNLKKFMGDAFMATYMKSATDAVLMAIELKSVLNDFNQQVAKDYHTVIDEICSKIPNFSPKIVIRTGIATGSFIEGSIGSHERNEEGAIGTTPNLASRLESLGNFFKTEGIIIDENTKLEVEIQRQDIVFRKLYPITPVNSRDTVRIYEVSGYKKDMNSQQIKVVNLNNEAIGLLEKGNLVAATILFEKIILLNNKDPYAYFYLSRINAAIQIIAFSSSFKSAIKAKNWINVASILLLQSNYLMNNKAEKAWPLIMRVTEYGISTNQQMKDNNDFFLDIEHLKHVKLIFEDMLEAFMYDDENKFSEIIKVLRENRANPEFINLLQEAFRTKTNIFDMDISKFFYPTEK